MTGRGEDLDAVLITRHLEFSLPYRALFSGRGIPDLRTHLLNALVELLARLHLRGFFWGDCSLSNTLFRRDAGALSAYLVDAETGELHGALSDGQRAYDLDIAQTNIVGELLDVDAEVGLPADLDPDETGDEIVRRYESLWVELTKEEMFAADERFKVDERLHRLNELGFDVEEIQLDATPDGYRLRLDPHVVEPGHHRHRLLRLTGLDAQERQARRMLNDIARYREALERKEKRPLPESVVASNWREQVFEPTIAAIPEELHGRLPPAEIFHQVLEHRWFLSEQAGKDVGIKEAARAYVEVRAAEARSRARDPRDGRRGLGLGRERNASGRSTRRARSPSRRAVRRDATDALRALIAIRRAPSAGEPASAHARRSDESNTWALHLLSCGEATGTDRQVVGRADDSPSSARRIRSTCTAPDERFATCRATSSSRTTSDRTACACTTSTKER